MAICAGWFQDVLRDAKWVTKDQKLIHSSYFVPGQKSTEPMDHDRVAKPIPWYFTHHSTVPPFSIHRSPFLRRARMSDSPLGTGEGRAGNPLISLAVAAIHAVMYVLNQTKNLVTWCTITFPSYVLYFPYYGLTNQTANNPAT
jgi:hypothetical protein